MSYTAGTYTPKKGDHNKSWHLIDATDLVVGRLSSEVAKLLRGKHKPSFDLSQDSGDCVIITNAEKVKFTGKKLENRKFHWHTGHPGGVKERTMEQLLTGKFPERVLEKAIERMMPKESPLARKQMKCLHVYAGESHPHESQKPVKMDIAAKNRKNVRGTK